MKKILVVAIGRLFSNRSTRSALLLPVIALGLSLAFRTPAKAQTATPTPGRGHQPCIVCHTAEKNPHEITIDCNALERHLRNHPEDRAGPCPQPTPTPTPTPKPTPSPKPTPPGRNKCEVCHNPHNYHTIRIPCDKVDKFLENHPGDFRGPCEITPVTNP
jgi:hypothetical protein